MLVIKWGAIISLSRRIYVLTLDTDRNRIAAINFKCKTGDFIQEDLCHIKGQLNCFHLPVYMPVFLFLLPCLCNIIFPSSSSLCGFLLAFLPYYRRISFHGLSYQLDTTFLSIQQHLIFNTAPLGGQDFSRVGQSRSSGFVTGSWCGQHSFKCFSY